MKLFRFLVLFLIAGACIDPYKFKSNRTEEAIVVDGMISDQPGPYLVKIYNTIPVDNQLQARKWVEGAQVTITDNTGYVETLTEATPGNYVTASIQGVIGNSYALKITTAEGSAYESTPETLLPLGDITDLHAEFVQNEAPGSYPLTTTNGFNIYISTTVLPEQGGRVRWRWSGTFEILTYPQLRTKNVVGGGGTVITVPDPVPCSGYTVRRNVLTQVGECTCCNCWTTLYNGTPLLSADGFIVDGKISDRQIAFIPANRRLFYNKFVLDVEQVSLSQSTYDFWDKVATQQQQGSDLFQTPPASTTGNMHPLTDGQTKMIGMFAAGSIRRQSISLYHNDVPYYLPSIDTIKQDCKYTYLFNTTATKPSYY